MSTLSPSLSSSTLCQYCNHETCGFNLLDIYPDLVNRYSSMVPKAPSMQEIKPYFDKIVKDNISSTSVSSSSFHQFCTWFDSTMHIIRDLNVIYPSKDYLLRTIPSFAQSRIGTFVIRCTYFPNILKVTFKNTDSARRSFNIHRVSDALYTISGSYNKQSIFALLNSHKQLTFLLTSNGHIAKESVSKSIRYVPQIRKKRHRRSRSAIHINQSTTKYIHNIQTLQSKPSHLITVYGDGHNSQNNDNNSDNKDSNASYDGNDNNKDEEEEDEEEEEKEKPMNLKLGLLISPHSSRSESTQFYSNNMYKQSSLTPTCSAISYSAAWDHIRNPSMSLTHSPLSISGSRDSLKSDRTFSTFVSNLEYHLEKLDEPKKTASDTDSNHSMLDQQTTIEYKTLHEKIQENANINMDKIDETYRDCLDPQYKIPKDQHRKLDVLKRESSDNVVPMVVNVDLLSDVNDSCEKQNENVDMDKTDGIHEISTDKDNDVVSSVNRQISIVERVLEGVQNKIRRNEFMCSDSEDESENCEMDADHFMMVCPQRNEYGQNYRNGYNNNNNDNNDKSNNNRYNHNNNNNNNYGSNEGSGFGSGSNGCNDDTGDDEDDEDEDDEKESDDSNSNKFMYGKDPKEAKELILFLDFLLHKIRKCDNAQMEKELNTFSDPCVRSGIKETRHAVLQLDYQLSRIERSLLSAKRKQYKSKKRPKCNYWKTTTFHPNVQHYNPKRIQELYPQRAMNNLLNNTEIPCVETYGTEDKVRDKYEYAIKSLAINNDACYKDPGGLLEIYNSGCYSHESNQYKYFITEPFKNINNKRKIGEILTKSQIRAKYDHIAVHLLPEPKRIHLQLKQVKQQLMKLETQTHILKNTKWHKVPIHIKQDNKRRMELKLTKEEFQAQYQLFIDDKHDILPFPIVTFDDNDNYSIQYVWIVSIEPNIDIGVALRCEDSLGRFSVVGIYLNKVLLYKQHQILCTSQQCEHLKHFRSCINYMHIGNADDHMNALNARTKKLNARTKELQKSNDRNRELENQLKYLQNSIAIRGRSISTETTPSICSNSQMYDTNSSSKSLMGGGHNGYASISNLSSSSNTSTPTLVRTTNSTASLQLPVVNICAHPSQQSDSYDNHSCAQPQ